MSSKGTSRKSSKNPQRKEKRKHRQADDMPKRKKIRSVGFRSPQDSLVQSPETHLVVPLQSLVPSLHNLIALRKSRMLGCKEAVDATKRFCLEFCQKWTDIAKAIQNGSFSPRFEVFPGVMKRILLYHDEDLDIRAHLFQSAEENYIHNHGAAFISTCLQGGYTHKLWSIIKDDSANNMKSYCSIERLSGGILNYESFKPKEEGSLCNVLCQPFEAGQSLFISSQAFHTVVVDSERGPVTTIIVKNKDKDNTTIVLGNSKEELEAAPASEKQEATEEERNQSIQAMGAACKVYEGLTYAPPIANYYFQQQVYKQLEDMKKGIDIIKSNVGFLTDRELQSQSRELAVGVTVYLINWALPNNLNQIKDAKIRLMVLTWLETLLGRCFEPTELDLSHPRFATFSKTERVQRRNDFLRICCSANSILNGWEMCKHITASDNPSAEIQRRCPDLRLRPDFEQKSSALVKGKKDLLGQFLFYWARSYCPALQELESWILTSIDGKMKKEGQSFRITPEKPEGPSQSTSKKKQLFQ